MEPIEEQELNDFRTILSGIELKEIARRIKKSETTTRNALKHGFATLDTWAALRKLSAKIKSANNQKEVKEITAI